MKNVVHISNKKAMQTQPASPAHGIVPWSSYVSGSMQVVALITSKTFQPGKIWAL